MYLLHRKGGLYQVLGTAMHSENKDLMVIYRCVDGTSAPWGDVWVRPLYMSLMVGSSPCPTSTTSGYATSNQRHPVASKMQKRANAARISKYKIRDHRFVNITIPLDPLALKSMDFLNRQEILDEMSPDEIVLTCLYWALEKMAQNPEIAKKLLPSLMEWYGFR